MTAIAVIVVALGALLIYSAVMNQKPIDLFKSVLSGES